jgi:energy-coupling factor transport system substrate-specific component
MLAAYGAIAGLVYGLIMDMWFWPFAVTPGSELSFVPGAGLVENLQRFWAFHLVSALGFDIPRALSNAALVLVLGSPVLAALRRAAHRAAFGAPVSFEPAPEAAPGSFPDEETAASTPRASLSGLPARH